MHIERRHSIVLPLPVERAFPLFTAKGEIDWVDGWDPQFLHPPDGEMRDGMVFTTEASAEKTLWACVAWAPDERRVRYVRVTPGSRFGLVEVVCAPLSAAETSVSVAYAFTALSPEGEAYLESLTPEAFAAMIDDWKRLILERIVGSETAS